MRMAKNTAEIEKTEKTVPLDLGEALTGYIQRNRKVLGILALVIVAILAALVAGLGIRDALRGSGLKAVEELSRRYDTLAPDIKDTAKETETAALLEDLTAFAGKHSGYAGARAYSLAAQIHAGKEEWADAEQNWRAAAKTGAKTYLAPVSLCNAAAALEEQGNAAGALELYIQSLSFAGSFPAAPRAQFSVGRIREELGDADAALEAYNEILSRWPNDPVWPNLAQSRIIALTIAKQ